MTKMKVIPFDANGPPSDRGGRSIFTTVPKNEPMFNPIHVGERVIATQEGEGWWATVVAVEELDNSPDHLGIHLRPDYFNTKDGD